MSISTLRMTLSRLCAAAALACGFSTAFAFTPALDDLDRLPLRAASAVVVQKALSNVTPSKSEPLRYAVSVPLPLTLDDGLWDSPEPGISRWRSRVLSSGALSLSMKFSSFHLPPGGALWIYDSQGQLVQGPYTQASETPEGKLWTAVVLSDLAVLELRVPTAEKSAVQLQLQSVAHGFLDVWKAGIGGTSAGSCEIDVACTDGNAWPNEIRSIAQITIEDNSNPLLTSQILCTGQLVNNFRQDSTPYLLTANHCKAANNPSSVVAYWNFQKSGCGSGTSSTAQNQSGSTLLAHDQTSDFTLLKLNARPAAGFNVYYAGFDASGSTPLSGVAIHHPQGDVKKISTYTAPASRVDNQPVTEGTSTFNVNAWQVTWARGVTEQGSSGSALWDQNHHIVGVLSGGGSSCSATTSPDVFARLDGAWQASTSSAAGQLKAWLDPDNSGRLTLCGQNADSPCDSSIKTSGTSSPGAVSGSGGSGSGSSRSGGGGAWDVGSALLMLLSGLAFRRRPQT